jgi:thioesterase domain-containing protein/acyl carrier protein
VVIGGTGGIGRNICLDLLRDATAQIDILGRITTLPAVLRHAADRITMHRCDLTQDPVQWPDLSGPIDTVVFAAGTGSYAPLGQRDAAAMRIRNRIKTSGLLALERLIARETPRAVIYCSSMASQMGGVGQLDYAATNGLLDGFAHWRNPAAPDTRRMVINWDIWSESGMATAALPTDAAHQRHLSYGLSDAEGRAVFAQALALGRPQVLVSTLPLDLAAQFYEADPTPTATVKAATAPQAIAQILARLLGTADIPPDQPLSDLGVDSLGLIDLLEALGATFGTAPALSDIAPDITATGLAALLMADRPPPTATDLAKQIAALTGAAKVGPDDSLESLGVDSLLALDLIQWLQSAYGITVSLQELHPQQTATGLARALTPALSGTSNNLPDIPVTVHKWQSGTGHQTVCLIHPVGGETAAYKTLAAQIGPEVTILAISDPNLTAQTLHQIDLPQRAARYLDALDQTPNATTKNLTLAGWSFGAWVAQEMAVQSQKRANPVRRLTMIDPPEPDAGSRLAAYTTDEIEAALLHDLLPQLAPHAGSHRPLDSKITPELQSYLDRIVRCCEWNMEAMRRHRPRPLADTTVRIFIAEHTAQGLLVDPIDVAAHGAKWRALIDGPNQTEAMQADHYSIMDMPAVQQIASGLFD